MRPLRLRVQTLREGADKGIDVTVNIAMPSADVGVTPKARSVAVSSAHSSGYRKSKANPKPLAKSATRSLQAAETERDPTAGPSSDPVSVQPPVPVHDWVFVTRSRGYAYHSSAHCGNLKCAKSIARL